MEAMEKVLQKLKEARKSKGLSHENMASELGISQSAYTNIESSTAKLTVDRLLKIAEVLEQPIYSFFDAVPNNVYNQHLAANSIGYQQIDTLHQDNKELQQKLTETYEASIAFLKDEIAYLKNKLEQNA